MRNLIYVPCLIVGLLVATMLGADRPASMPESREPLPPPDVNGKMTLEQTIAMRRSVREFAAKTLTREQIGQLCWAGQGITDPSTGYRAAPSAGALYPIELYLVTAAGVEHYLPREHALRTHLTGDLRRQLQRASLDHKTIGDAPLIVVVTAVVSRSKGKYGSNAYKYCLLEAGHVAQNILLQATALHLAAVPVGAFDDRSVAGILRLPGDHRVVYLLPIGHPRGAGG